MRDRDYYPSGAYNDPSAPWNERETPERDFDMEVTVTANRKVTITSTRYNMFIDDEDGHTYIEMCDDMDWLEHYTEQYWTLHELMGRVRHLLESWKPEKLSVDDRELYNRIMDETSGWIETDAEVYDHE